MMRGLERVCIGKSLVRGEGTGTMSTEKIKASASPWFVGVGENLVVRKLALA
jgi:hypothetical protein